MANQGPAYYSPYPAATYEGVITPPEGKECNDFPRSASIIWI
jgi:hypothetical protein